MVNGFTVHLSHDYTITQRLVFSVTLLSSVFQQWTFLCPQAHVLSGWRPSHFNVLLLSLPSQDSVVMRERERKEEKQNEINYIWGGGGKKLYTHFWF
jgi:hypothetical protein